jgi:hypothetical protein
MNGDGKAAHGVIVVGGNLYFILVHTEFEKLVLNTNGNKE